VRLQGMDSLPDDHASGSVHGWSGDWLDWLWVVLVAALAVRGCVALVEYVRNLWDIRR
jgi:hypothetical protein